MTTSTVNPRSIGIEGHYTTGNVAELAELKRRLLAAGVSKNLALGLIGWLVDKAAGSPDLTASDTRSRYRKLLAELGDELPDDPRGKAVPTRADKVLVMSSLRRHKWGLGAGRHASNRCEVLQLVQRSALELDELAAVS